VSRFLKLFIHHLLTKVRGDAVAEYLKVYKSLIKFFGKCLLIKDGKEVPSTVLTLVLEILGWLRDDLISVGLLISPHGQNSVAQTLFALTIARVFDALSNKEWVFLPRSSVDSATTRRRTICWCLWEPSCSRW